MPDDNIERKDAAEENKAQPHADAPKPEQASSPKASGKEDDVIEVDFGKIGKSISGIFSKSKEEAKEEKKEKKADEEYLETVEIDVDQIGKKIINNKPIAVFGLLLLILAFSLSIRLASADSVLSPDFDTYLHYRYAREILRNDMQVPAWDTLSYYPPGRPFAEPPGYPLAEAYFYLFMKHLVPGIALMTSSMILTSLVGGIAVLFAFVIGREASGDIGGLFSAFFVGTIPAILVRTMGSYADTDASVIFFTLLVVALYVKAIEAYKEKITPKALVYTALAGLAAGAFAMTWGTFYYIIYILFLLPFAMLGLHFVFGEGDIAKRLSNAFGRTKLLFFATALFFIIPFFIQGFVSYPGMIDNGGVMAGLTNIKSGFGGAIHTYTDPAGTSELKAESGGVAGTGKNVFISVAEMQPPDWSNYTTQMGLTIYLALSFFILGSSLLLYKMVPEKSHDQLTYGIAVLLVFIAAGVYFTQYPVSTLLTRFLVLFGGLFFIGGISGFTPRLRSLSNAFFENETQINIMVITLIWGAVLFITSILGVRFLLLLAPPVAIAAGVLVDRLINAAGKIYPKFSPILFLAFVLLVLTQFAPQAYMIGQSGRGTMDSNWHDMLTWVKLNTPSDSTLTTWWDPGHWVTAIAERRSGADGAHYPGGPMPINQRIHDFGWAFTTTNETESVNTLRPYLGNSSQMYFISSNDLIGKFVWLSYFSTGQKLQYITLQIGQSYPQTDFTLHVYPMSQNIAVVIKEYKDGSMEPWIYMNNNKARIKEIVYFDAQGRAKKVTSPDGEDAMVWVQGDKNLVVYMPGSIKDNILTKTYFFGGEGLNDFELVFANQMIKLYRVKF